MQKSGIGENRVDRGLRWLELKGNTIPSVFRLTLRMMPKEPFPMMSSESYWSRNEDIGEGERKKSIWVARRPYNAQWPFRTPSSNFT